MRKRNMKVGMKVQVRTYKNTPKDWDILMRRKIGKIGKIIDLNEGLKFVDVRFRGGKQLLFSARELIVLEN